MAESKTLRPDFEWPFGLDRDLPWVVKTQGDQAIAGACAELALGARLSDNCSVFSYPKVVVFRLPEPPVSNPIWRFVTVEPGYAGYKYRIAHWVRAVDPPVGGPQPEAVPVVHEYWLTDEFFGESFLWVNFADFRQYLHPSDLAWLQEEIPDAFYVHALNMQALLVACAVAYLAFQVMQLLESTSSGTWERLFTLVALVALAGYLAYGYAESRLQYGEDRWTQYITPAMWSVALAFVGSVVGQISLKA